MTVSFHIQAPAMEAFNKGDFVDIVKPDSACYNITVSAGDIKFSGYQGLAGSKVALKHPPLSAK